MKPDLIEQLKKLNPTDGEWHAIDFAGFINILNEPYYEGKNLLNAEDCPNDYLINGELASLAPTMRLEILAMAKEIEFLNERIEGLKRQLTNGSPF